jgi:hypothetical protein
MHQWCCVLCGVCLQCAVSASAASCLPYLTSPLSLATTPAAAADVGRFWVGRQGLARSTPFTWNNPQMRCTVYSSSRATAVRAPAGGTEVQLCEVWNTGHSTDQPWPGYMFGQARWVWDAGVVGFCVWGGGGGGGPA